MELVLSGRNNLTFGPHFACTTGLLGARLVSLPDWDGGGAAGRHLHGPDPL
jgi:hypothetical protein